MNRHSPGKLQRYLTECSNNSFIHSMIFYTLPFCNFNSVVLIESIRMNKYIVLMKFFDSSKITIYQSTFKILCHHYTRSDLEFEFYRTNIIFSLKSSGFWNLMIALYIRTAQEIYWNFWELYLSTRLLYGIRCTVSVSP